MTRPATHIIFLHGLESGPHGSKYQSLIGAGWSVTAPDCTGLTDVGMRVERARHALQQVEGPVVLVGSSFGGLTATLLYSAVAGSAEGTRVHGLLLLAPAFHFAAAQDVEAIHANTMVLHGTLDDVVPVEASRAFATRFACRLVEVEDGHRLAASHAEILRLLEEVARGAGG